MNNIKWIKSHFFHTVIIVAGLILSTLFADKSAERLSFQSGIGSLVGWPSFGILRQSTGIFFEATKPAKLEGLFYQFGTLMGITTQYNYINNRDDNYKQDKDRNFYWGGFTLGPAFRTDGPLFYSGSMGILIVGNYAVDTEFGPGGNSSFTPDSGSHGDISLGSKGTMGVGYTFLNSTIVQFDLVFMAATSENAPGIFGGFGPRLMVGKSF